jgi:hypothetical protein
LRRFCEGSGERSASAESSSETPTSRPSSVGVSREFLHRCEIFRARRGLAGLQQRCLKCRGGEDLEVAPSNLRVRIFARDHLTLLGDARIAPCTAPPGWARMAVPWPRRIGRPRRGPELAFPVLLSTRGAERSRHLQHRKFCEPPPALTLRARRGHGPSRPSGRGVLYSSYSRVPVGLYAHSIA